jgi:pyruvate/2-oxoglutarate dehydrogenase complex dihydrolipoamide dehydrogenase (E3) component
MGGMCELAARIIDASASGSFRRRRQHPKHIAIIGPGRIGRAWAIVFARAGFSVNLHDASKDMLRGAIASIRKA